MNRVLGNVKLRKLTLKDAPIIANLLNNKKIWDNLRDYIPYPYKVFDAESFIKRENIEEPLTAFGILYRNKLAGIISLKRQVDVHRLSAEIGYWLGEEYWGSGITHKAVKLMTSYGFNELHLLKIYAVIMASNEPSKRVLEKAGYEKEGYFKKSVIKNGIICDEVRFGISKEDFKF